MKFRSNLFIILIILISFVVRLYFFDVNVEIPASDEGEYMIMTNSFAQGQILYQWPFYRPFLLPFIWGNLGFSLLAIRISLILFSLLSIFLIYLIVSL